MKRPLRFIATVLTLLAFTFMFPAALLAQWEPNRNISPNAMSAALNENANQCIAVSGDTLHVVYSDHRSNGWAIYYTQSPDSGNTWSTPMPITDTTGKASMPSIAVNGLTVHVTWMDSISGHRASYYKRSLDGGVTWGNNVVLDSTTDWWPGVATSGALVVATINKNAAVGNSEVFYIISPDSGHTWGTEQRLTNAPGRSEDPAIAIKDSSVNLSWNDNRNGPMEIYYCHSANAGGTWGPQMALTSSDSYSSMVCVDDTNVDVPFGFTISSFLQVNLRQSPDTGGNFAPIQQLTNAPVIELYPYMVRDGLNLHLVYLKFGAGGGPWYLHSDDGGVNWYPTDSLGTGGQPFIAYTGCTLHVIWPDSGAIHYRRNPTGNCAMVTGIAPLSQGEGPGVRLYPNPFSTQTTIEISSSQKVDNAELKVYNVLGQEMISKNFESDGKIILKRNEMNSGMYFYRVFQKSDFIATGKMLIE